MESVAKGALLIAARDYRVVVRARRQLGSGLAIRTSEEEETIALLCCVV
jgi:hypothetical protein